MNAIAAARAFATRDRLMFLARYAVVGGATAVIYAGVYWVAEPRLSPYGGATAAFLAAVFFQYLGHAKFTFGVPARDHAQVGRFLTTTACGYATAMTLAHFSEVNDWPRLIGVATMLVLIPVVNFLVFVFWVFSGRDGAGS